MGRAPATPPARTAPAASVPACQTPLDDVLPLHCLPIQCLPAGYYGTSANDTFSEKSRSGSDFLSEVCREWEAIADEAQVGTSLTC